MSNLKELFVLQGTNLKVLQTDCLNFHLDSPFFFFLDEGEIDLFFVQTEDPKILSLDELKYSSLEIKDYRSFFRSIQPSSIFFSIPHFRHPQIRMFGMPEENTSLYYLSYEKMLMALSESKELQSEFLPHLDVWLNGFAKHLQKFPVVTKISEYVAGIHLLKQGDHFVCKEFEKKQRVFWIQVIRGSIQLLDIPSLIIDENTEAFYPATRDMWFVVLIDSSIKVFAEEDVGQAQNLLQGANLFLKHFLTYFSSEIQKEIQKEKQQLILKNTLIQQNLELAVDQLETVVDKEEIFFRQKGGSLYYNSCQLVGDFLDIKFDPFSKAKPMLSVYENVEQLCFDSRVHYRMISFVPNWWKNNIGPFVAFSLKKKIPLALIPQKGHYQIVDPEKTIKMPLNEFTVERISSQGFEFFRSFPLKNLLTGKDLFFFASFRKFGTVIAILVLSILMSLFNIFTPFLNAVLFDVAVPIGDNSLLLQIFLSMLMIAIGSEMFILGREFMIIKLEEALDREFESAIWQRVLDLPLRFFRQFQIGDLFIRIFSVSEIRKTFSGQALRIILNSLLSLIYLIPMLYYSFYLSLVGLATSFLGIICTAWALAKNVEFHRQILDLKAKMNNQILALLAGISKIRIFGAENLIFVLWEKIFYPIKRIEWSMQRLNNVVDVINFTISSLATLSIYAIVIIVLQDTGENRFQITTGEFLAFLAAFAPFSIAVTDLSDSLLQTIKMLPLWKKSQVLFHNNLEVDFTKSSPDKLKGNIEVDHLSFRYENCPHILEDISLKIKEGENIGIVGLSGCGKSTLLRLLIGFEVPESGAIYYDHKDLSTLDLKQVRKQMGIILQTSTLFDGTIYENIATSGFYTEQQIEQALYLAGFEEDLKRLPMGINTVLMDKGNTLSGGQRQRLLIARALVSEPKILILDEATSALDNATQDFIARNLELLNVTRITVAHRLMRLKKVDRIYVLSQGRIEDIGTFDELAARKGTFSHLLAKQKVT